MVLVGSNDPSVARVRAAYLLGESVPTAQGDAAVVVLMDDGVDAGVAWWDAGTDVSHGGGHEDVAGPFARGE